MEFDRCTDLPARATAACFLPASFKVEVKTQPKFAPSAVALFVSVGHLRE